MTNFRAGDIIAYYRPSKSIWWGLKNLPLAIIGRATGSKAGYYHVEVVCSARERLYFASIRWNNPLKRLDKRYVGDVYIKSIYELKAKNISVYRRNEPLSKQGRRELMLSLQGKVRTLYSVWGAISSLGDNVFFWANNTERANRFCSGVVAKSLEDAGILKLAVGETYHPQELIDLALKQGYRKL